MSDNLLKFKKFMGRSKAKFSDLYSRIDKCKSFLSSKQWEKGDDKYISNMRNRVTINVIANQVNSVSNSYSAFPFTWFTGNPDTDKRIDDFFDVDSNKFASEEAILDCVSFGLGVLALGTDTDVNGQEVPVIYAVDDVKRVMLDPDSVELDGSDAMEGALIDYRSREWIRVHMGDSFVPDDDKRMICENASCAELVPIVTYYVLDTDGCHVYTFVNDKEVTNTTTDENGVEVETDNVIPIRRIPLFPVWGERSWDGDKKTYIGLVDKSKDVQRIVNYAFTQLAERLALSPKPQWQGYAEAFKGLDQYYKNAGTGINPIIPSNRLANDNKTILEMPKRLDNQIQFADVQGIVQGTLGMLSSITGVDSKGLADVETDVTATAVNYTSKVFQNNIRHFFMHLRTSFKAVGDVVLSLWGVDGHVQVTQGPEDYMEMQVARQEIASIIPVSDPTQKPMLINAILRTHPRNEILAQLYAEINSKPIPTQNEIQLQSLVEQMKQAIEAKDQEILQLTEANDAYRKSSADFEKSMQADFIKAEQAHNFKMEEIALQSQLNGNAEAAKVALEMQKGRMDLEAKAVALDAQKVKAASEMMKAMNNVNNTNNGAF